MTYLVHVHFAKEILSRQGVIEIGNNGIALDFENTADQLNTLGRAHLDHMALGHIHMGRKRFT